MMQLKDVVTRITADTATETAWKTDGIENYVILKEDDTTEKEKKEWMKGLFRNKGHSC